MDIQVGDSTGDERGDPLHLKCGLGFPVGLKYAAARKMMLCGAEKLAEKEIKNCRNLVSGSFSNLILMTR